MKIQSVFVGAGMSIGAGLPSWVQLITPIAESPLPPVEYLNATHLIQAAQTHVNQQGVNSLISYLKEQLDGRGKQPTVAHEALTQLPINLIFTANYDDLLERAYRQAGKRVHVVVRDTDLPYLLNGDDCVNIIKLYGDLNQPDTIVLTTEQYNQFFRSRPDIINLLRTTLHTSTMLYLGWSHTDPHFNLLFGEILGKYDQNLRRGYALMFAINEHEKQELQRKQINCVQLPTDGDWNQQIADWLHAQHPQPSKKAPLQNEEQPMSEIQLALHPELNLSAEGIAKKWNDSDYAKQYGQMSAEKPSSHTMTGGVEIVIYGFAGVGVYTITKELGRFLTHLANIPIEVKTIPNSNDTLIATPTPINDITKQRFRRELDDAKALHEAVYQDYRSTTDPANQFRLEKQLEKLEQDMADLTRKIQ